MKLLLCILGLLYIISPYDLFPDFFIGAGWIDDLAVLLLMVWYLYVYSKGKEGRQREKAYGGQGEPREKPAGRDPYTVLGVKKDASPDEIRRAYRHLAGQYHPDKVQHLGEEFGELAERRFKEIQRAYQELTAK